jgi:S1-C subfamily serine protease
MNRIIFIVSVLAFSLGIVVGSLFLLVSYEDGQSKQASLSHIIETVSPTVVSISATSMDGTSVVSREGTGIIVSSRGLVLTSKHLISP